MHLGLMTVESPRAHLGKSMANQAVIKNPCELLLDIEIQGEKRPGIWRVVEKYVKDIKGTGGNFSVGYKAIHEDGTEAFLKATDIGLLKRHSSQSALVKMSEALNEQTFERTILEICHGNNMDRVVHALDYGEYETTHEGVRDFVFFIMFEIAESDVRQQIDQRRRGGMSWTATALHNLAVAIHQLHTEKIAHNDIKPSNFLVFDEHLQKIADLGRATYDKQVGPWDTSPFSGDQTYAAPEFYYRAVTLKTTAGKIAFEVRQASDLYLLGSLGYFLITGEAMTPMILNYLRPEHHPNNWCGTYEDVLPYVWDAHGEAMALFDNELPADEAGNIVKIAMELRNAIVELTSPPPNKRGHPKNILQQASQYSLERYISLFNRIAKSMALVEGAK